MEMNFSACTAKYSDSCVSSSLRLSAPMLTRFATNPEPLSIVTGSKYPRASIGELSVASTACVVKKGELDQAAQLIDLENIGPWGAISEVGEVTSIGSNRLLFGDCDVLTSKLRPYLGKTIHNIYPEGIGTTEWVPLKVDSGRLRPRLLGYLLQSSHYVEMSSAFMAGKEHPRITPEDIHSLQVPLPPLIEQDALIKALDGLSKSCRDLELSIGSELDLVDNFFERKFGLDVAKLDAQTLLRERGLNMAGIASNPDMRFSFKFHAPSVEFALNALRSRPHKRVGDFIAEDIVLGASVSPSDYDSDSDKLYLSMATIKSWAFSRESANGVSEKYFADNVAKSVREGDILMARSGEGTIGKVALVQGGIRGICADFTMRIRMDPQLCLPEFGRFYFMSKYFQHAVYGEKKGLGNNTNIFPVQMRELPIIDVPLARQRDAVDELTELRDDHIAERSEIVALRKKMEEVLTLGLRGLPFSHLIA